MSKQASIGTISAECSECGWTFERSLDAGDLDAEDNREIATRVVRSHSFKCQTDGDDWGEQADVEIEMDLTGDLDG